MAVASMQIRSFPQSKACVGSKCLGMTLSVPMLTLVNCRCLELGSTHRLLHSDKDSSDSSCYEVEINLWSRPPPGIGLEWARFVLAEVVSALHWIKDRADFVGSYTYYTATKSREGSSGLPNHPSSQQQSYLWALFRPPSFKWKR